jgi:hypothetical protein
MGLGNFWQRAAANKGKTGGALDTFIEGLPHADRDPANMGRDRSSSGRGQDNEELTRSIQELNRRLDVLLDRMAEKKHEELR